MNTQVGIKGIIAGLAVILALLQYKLWIGNGSFAEVYRLNQAIAAQEKENSTFKERNLALEAEVNDLSHGMDAIEERARFELGMIKSNETFFRVIDR
jgi:cell division protein FtsB